MAGSHYRGNSVDDPVVWKISGNKFFKKGLYGIALRFYARAIQLNPDFIEAWNNIGLSFQKLGRMDEARRCNEKVKELRMRSGNPLDPVGRATRVRTAWSGSLLNDNFWYALCIAVLSGISLTILTFDPASPGSFQVLAFIWGFSFVWFVIAYLLLQFIFNRPE
ncbi:MAG TPA: tetratricopeptide repeat protein [Methanolinea sp.]|nr:tetratricopeptide repeat protein [Methanolinea sp.]HQK55826.1 tetratricopeptide repeat protein [Methanolinea sp.]